VLRLDCFGCGSVLWIGGVSIVMWRTFLSIPEPVLWGAKQIPKNASQSLERAPWEEELPDAPWVIEQRAAIRFAILLALVPPAFLLAYRH